MKTIHTVFETNHNVFKGKDKNEISIFEWEKQLALYLGDLTNVDLANDGRFKQVLTKNIEMRKQSILLGTLTDAKFPLVYPCVLDNSYVCDGNYAEIKDEEDDYIH